MLRFARPIALAACLLFAGHANAAATDSQVTLQVKETPEAWLLDVPVSKLVMTIPKGSLVREAHDTAGAQGSPRYFMFHDPDRAIIVSGWFESADGFKGTTEYWATDTAEWKKHGLPEPRDVTFEKIGNWDAIIYDLPVPSGGTNSHISAHWVQAGTWIDIHLSMTTSSKETSAQDRAVLKSLIETITVSEKKE